MSRFPGADAAWLHMDRPTNLMVINAVMLFDEPVDWERLEQLVRQRLVDRYPRFHRLAVESRLPLRAPKWVEDRDFALEHHLHHLALPAPGNEAALQDLIADLMTMPLHRSRPLWHFYMVDGFGDGAALIVRMHHCIADGIALARVMLSLTDSDPDAGIAAPGQEQIDASGPLAGVVRLGGLVGRTASGVLRQGMQIATSPSHAVRLAGAIGRDAATLVRLTLTPADAATAIKGEPGISRRVAWTRPLSLPRIRAIAHRHDATVNDVLVAAASGALRHYLQERGSPVAEIAAMVPYNLRPLHQPVPRELGNKFGLVFLALPVGTTGAYRRLVEVSRRMAEIKQGRDGPVSYGLLRAIGHVPEPVERRIVDLFSSKGTAVVTNVPGPRDPVYLAGTPLRTVLVWAPTSGRIGMSLSIFSYRREVTVGLMVDAALVPDPNRIATELETELRALARLERTSHRPATSPRPARRGRGTHQPTTAKD